MQAMDAPRPGLSGESTMNTVSMMTTEDRRHYELRFRSLFDAGRAYAFDCDAGGHVNLDALSAAAKVNYLYARTTIGREFCTPEVKRRPPRSPLVRRYTASAHGAESCIAPLMMPTIE
jgi:hypothetical protein